MKHLPLVAASLVFAAVCGSAAYWGMQWFQPPARAVAAVPKAAPPPLNIEAAAGLFGGAPAGAAVATTFQLKGVIEDGPEGVAILVAEGKPPVAVGVNQEAAPGVTVQEIHQTYVMLNDGGTVKRLDLPLSAIAGLEIVSAAAPADKFDAPGRPLAPRMPVTTVARSGGAMPPPVVNPDIVTAPGQAPPQGLPMEMIERMRMSRPSGIGPGAFGAKPNT
jgi:general secretion pathway protein C